MLRNIERFIKKYLLKLKKLLIMYTLYCNLKKRLCGQVEDPLKLAESFNSHFSNIVDILIYLQFPTVFMNQKMLMIMKMMQIQ